MPYSERIDEYLKNSSSAERIALLEAMRVKQDWLPLSLSQDLMCLKLSEDELHAILRATSSKYSLSFEDFLTRQIPQWNQNIASTALWEWAVRSDRLLWHRTIPISADPHLPQRLAYTMLDLAWCGGGRRVIATFADKEGIEEMSPAFLALLYFRALQWNVSSARLLHIAEDTVKQSIGSRFIPERTVPYLLAYLYRFKPEWAEKLKTDQTLTGLWSQFHGASFSELQQELRIKKLELQCGKNLGPKTLADLLHHWPMIWERHKISDTVVSWLLQQFAKLPAKQRLSNLWEYFAGIPQSTLDQALSQTKDEKVFLFSLSELNFLINDKSIEGTKELIRNFLQQSKDLNSALNQIPKRFSAFINSQENGKTPYDKAFIEQKDILKESIRITPDDFQNLSRDQVIQDHDDPDRGMFFDLVYRSAAKIDAKNIQNEYWQTLTDAWLDPKGEKLEKLANLARQMPFLFQISYVDTLGRFKGIDNAALKLLDYIRSQEENILRAVINALAGIKTNRSTQELVAFLTRPNVSFTLQMEITQILKDCDLTRLQHELRSAINDLRSDISSDEPVWELRETLTSLLLTGEQTASSGSPGDQPTSEDLDRSLRQRIPSFDLLSGEAKRALRTAQFFHLQVSSSGNLNTIDLSPAIDMQYKALELSFREKFEDITGAVIREGSLQRKLDVLGYARPIPRAMDDFERYIENLPTIKSIPFFSRFKLRKMLRAICQFRPGKRFTLDGLKAFALFFICFSRKECRYGLNNMLPIPDMSDAELYEYCKALHVFQDFRNRAAHEGFHPDASHDLDGIWTNTSMIIEGMFHMEQKIREATGQKSSLKTG
ncbi:MAG: hypothetical protein ACOH5I_11985 [Oligoflexus sp.]